MTVPVMMVGGQIYVSTVTRRASSSSQMRFTTASRTARRKQARSSTLKMPLSLTASPSTIGESEDRTEITGDGAIHDDVFDGVSCWTLCSMTGWRLGWLVAPKKLIGGMNRLQQNFYINGRYLLGELLLKTLVPPPCCDRI